MQEDENNWLNEWGLREWMKKEKPHITASRSYHWCDRVIFIDETQGRLYIGETTFTKFQEELDKWIEITPGEYEGLIEHLTLEHSTT